MRTRRSLALPAMILVAVATSVPAANICAEPQAVRIGWLSQTVKRALPLTYLDQPPEDEGIQGARLGIADDDTTGHFTGQSFELVERVVPEDGDVAASFRELVEWQICEGTNGLVPVGTTGESPTLSHHEHKQVV